MNWEVWIESGQRAVPWLMAVTFTDRTNFPRVLVEFLNWNLNPWLKAGDFSFRKPAARPRNPICLCDQAKRPLIWAIDEILMKHVFSLIATMTVGAVFLLPQTGCTGVYAVGPAYGPMVELTMAERASIMAPTMVVRPTGTMVPGAPTVRGVATLLGTMAREAPEDGAEALPHGITDRRVSAVTAADQLRGAVALAAQRVAGHGLLGRRLGLIPWGFRSLGLMETVMM